MTTSFLAFVAAVLLGLVIYAWWQQRRSTETTPAMSAPEEMAELAAGAVRAAQDACEVTLDYSVSSVERVEAILAQLHEEHQRTPFFPQRVVREANRWGAYVGEVARRVQGGAWQRDSAHVGANAYPLVFADQHEIYPCAWCFRRITNGAEDNVWVKFRLSVTERPETASSEARLVKS